MTKKLANPLTIALLGIALAHPAISSENLRLDRYQEPEDLGAPLLNVQVQHCIVAEEDGNPVAYFTAGGNPALFHVVDLEDQRLLATYELPNGARAWAQTLAPDGTVYLGGVGIQGAGRLYRYFPAEKRVEDLGPGVEGHRFIWALTAADDGRVYGGTWEGGHVFEYNPKTNRITDLGPIDPAEDYVRSIAWHGGFVYAGTGMRNGRVWRLNPETGDREQLPLPVRDEYAEDYGRMRGAYHLAVAGDTLFAYFNGPGVMLAYDLMQEEWWDETFTGVSGPLTGVYSERDDAYYFVGKEDGLWAADLASREIRKVMRYRGGFLGGGFVDLARQPGYSIASVRGDGAVFLIDVDRGVARTEESLAIGQETPIQALEIGPDGSVYVSGYMGATGAAIDPQTGEARVFPIGQAEGIAAVGDALYWGVYPGARIYRHFPGRNDSPPRRLFRIRHQQDRPFAMVASEDTLFIGTIADYGELDGALTIIDQATSNDPALTVYPAVVPRQSIVGLAYHPPSGHLIGSTSIHGGLGIEPEAESATMFVWDVASGKKVREFLPELPGLESPRMIGGLSLGPDGRIWGAVNGRIFALDPDSLEVVAHRDIYPEVKRYSQWRPAYLRWGNDGLLYTNVGGRLTVINPATLDHLSLNERSAFVALDRDGSIFYANGPRLKRIRVNP